MQNPYRNFKDSPFKNLVFPDNEVNKMTGDKELPDDDEIETDMDDDEDEDIVDVDDEDDKDKDDKDGLPA
jgi:hypothetical protein